MAKQWYRHFFVDHENFRPFAPINRIDDYRKEEQPHTIQPYNKTGKLEPTTYSSCSQI